jgi:DNA repair exonuclease SbcCD ATPase subunit
MIILKIVLHHFFRTDHVEIDLYYPGLTYILGRNYDVGKSNETGKSTIFMALLWCLWGKYPGGPGKPGDSVINPLFKNDCWVEVYLQDPKGNIFVCRRTRLSGEGFKESILSVKGNDVNEIYDLAKKGDTDESTNFISGLMGRDYNTFVRECYLPQEGVVPITLLSNTELKQFVMKSILNITWTEDCLIKAKKERDDLAKEILKEEGLVSGKLSLVKEVASNLKTYKTKQAEWKNEQAEKIEKMELDLDSLKIELSKILVSNADTEDQIKELQAENDSLEIEEDFDQLIRKANQEIHKWIGKQAGFKAELVRLDAEEKKLEGKMGRIVSTEGETCEVCGTTITPEHFPFMLKEYEQRLVEIPSKRRDLQKKSDDCQEQIGLYTREIEEVTKEKEENKLLLELRSEMSLTIQKLKGDMTDTKELEYRIKRREDEIHVEKNARSSFSVLLKETREKLSTCSAEVVEMRRQLVQKQKAKVMAEFWVKGFSFQGIPSLLLDNITPLINQNIQLYLSHLSDSRIKAELRTVRPLKGGGYKEDFGLDIDNRDGSNTFSSLSSGARRRTDLAVALAIADFKRSISPKETRLLVLDEVCNNLDSFWKLRFYELVRQYFSHYSTYIISHEDLDHISFDRTIKLQKKGGLTSVEGVE